MRTRLLSLVLAASALLPVRLSGQAPAAAMTNADVVRLVAMRLPDATVISVVNEVKVTQFDLTELALFDLADHGVSQLVIAAMRRPGTIAPPPPDPTPRPQTPPRAPVPLPTPEPPSIPSFEVGKIDDRITTQNSVYVMHAWQVTLHNYQGTPIAVTGEIQYLDAKGFIIARDFVLSEVIPAYGDTTIRGETLIRTGIATEVKTVNASFKRR